MLIKVGAIVAEMSGALGGIVAARNRGGAYLRNRTKPLVSTTEFALAAKALLAARSVAWQSLTEAQRDSWSAYAATVPVTNRLGETRHLTGHQTYIQLNINILNAGETVISAPPVTAAPDALLTLVADGDIGIGDFDLTFTATPLATDDMLYIFATIVSSPGINYVKNLLRFIGVSAAAQADPFDVESLFVARFGTPVVDQTVHFSVSVIDSKTGLLSVPITSKVVVTETS